MLQAIEKQKVKKKLEYSISLGSRKREEFREKTFL